VEFCFCSLCTSSRRAQTTFNLPLTSQGIHKRSEKCTYGVQRPNLLHIVGFLLPRICHSGEVTNDSGIIRCKKRYSNPVTGPVWPRGWVELQLYSSMTKALEGVSGQQHAPAILYPRERPGTHCTGGWVGPRVGLNRCRKSRPHLDSIPGPSSP
jgi:hypothetical protein